MLDYTKKQYMAMKLQDTYLIELRNWLSSSLSSSSSYASDLQCDHTNSLMSTHSYFGACNYNVVVP